jgi:hypothetical protein
VQDHHDDAAENENHADGEARIVPRDRSTGGPVSAG